MKILFVCTGNICRSPTAHAVFRHLARERGVDVYVESAGTYSGHIGHPADARAVRAAQNRGYDMSDLRARGVTHGDFEDFDLILCMDAGHKLTLERVAPKAQHSKIQMFDTRDVGDPYYGGEDGFERVLDQIEVACERWLDRIKP
jgi:protein-tyrosine phosphatase